MNVRTEIIDWMKVSGEPGVLEEIRIRPELVLATDIVFDGSPYDHFVKVVRNLGIRNNNLKVLVLMPSKNDRKKCDDFINLMVENSIFSHELIELPK